MIHMEMQEIEIVINADGDVIIHVNSVHGEKCTEITASLEEALGTVESRQYTGGLLPDRSPGLPGGHGPDRGIACTVQVHEKGVKILQWMIKRITLIKTSGRDTASAVSVSGTGGALLLQKKSPVETLTFYQNS